MNPIGQSAVDPHALAHRLPAPPPKSKQTSEAQSASAAHVALSGEPSGPHRPVTALQTSVPAHDDRAQPGAHRRVAASQIELGGPQSASTPHDAGSQRPADEEHVSNDAHTSPFG